MDDEQQHSSRSSDLACTSSSSSSVAVTLVVPSAHTASHTDQSSSSSSSSAVSFFESWTEVQLQRVHAFCLALGFDPSRESSITITKVDVFRSFVWKNKTVKGKVYPHGLSAKLWSKFKRRRFKLHLLLDAWMPSEKQFPLKPGKALWRPAPWEELHTLAQTNWAAFLLKLKLFLRSQGGARWPGSHHLCSWQSDGRSFRELFELAQHLPSFESYFAYLTLEDVDAGPDAVFHFFRAGLPSQVLAIVFRTQQHAIPVLDAVAVFRERYASVKDQDSADEFQQRGILGWIVHEIDTARSPRPDASQPAYTLKQCKRHLEQAGLMPRDGWPKEFDDAVDISIEFLNALFVQLCEDEGCPVETIAHPPIGLAILKRAAKEAEQTRRAAAVHAASSASAVMLDVQHEMNTTLTSLPHATSAPKAAKGKKRKTPAAAAPAHSTSANSDPVVDSTSPSESAGDATPAGASSSPAPKKPNASADRPFSLESPPRSPASGALASPSALASLAAFPSFSQSSEFALRLSPPRKQRCPYNLLLPDHDEDQCYELSCPHYLLSTPDLHALPTI